MRKSFILHNDSLEILDDLTDEQCGQLFKAIKAYQLGDDIEMSPIVKVAFSPFKNQFVRDAEKYEKLCEKNRLIALKRHSTKSTTGTSGNQSLPEPTKSTDNDSKSDSDSDSDSDKPLDQSAIDPDSIDFCFDQFWESGIRKVNKKKSKPLFAKVLNKHSKPNGPTSYDFTTMLVNDIQLRLSNSQLGFDQMHPTTYLNGERWNDEVKSNETHQQPNQQRSSAVGRVAAAGRRREAEIKARLSELEAMGSPGGDIRPPDGVSVRGRDASELEGFIEGDYTRSD